MSLLDKITNWPFENKWKTTLATISLLYLSPLQKDPLFYITRRGTLGFDNDIPPELSLGLGITTAYWLSFFGRIKQPRAKNFIRGTKIALSDIAADFQNNPEDKKEYHKQMLHYLNNISSKSRMLLEGNYHLRKGKFGKAMECYTEYLENESSKKKDFDESITDLIIENFLRAKVQLRGNITDHLEEIIYDFKEKNHERLFNKDWKRVLEQYPNDLELKVIHAMFLTMCKKQEAHQAWKEIEQDVRLKPKILGESRNAVYECTSDHFKQVIIIKKGKDLKGEWEHCEAIKEILKEKTIRPLAFYQREKEDVLIVKRNQGVNLETFCNEPHTKEEKENAREKALQNLGALHRIKKEEIKINIETYKPIQELERRCISRYGYSRNAELLVQKYQEFHQRRTKGESLVLCHGDFYPSNALQDGTIIDLEKMCLANPWFDLETFCGSPIWTEEEKESLFNQYPNPIANKERDFYKVHVALCQTGSFSVKKPEISIYFKRKALEYIAELQEDELKKQLRIYLHM